jgi:MFS family permease
LFLGSVVSNVGDGIRLAALPLLATSLTSSPLLISAVTAAQYLPWVTFAPVGGALVDRWDRRRTILITQAWRGLIVAGLALLVWADLAEIWQVWVVAFALTLGEILVDPSTVALVPTLVDDDDLDRANGRIASAEIVTNDFAGGPVGATLFGFAPWIPFLIDASSYLGSLLPFRKLPRATPQPHATADARARSVREDAGEGFHWLRHHAVLGPLTLAQVVYYFGFAPSLTLLVVLVTDELNASAAAFGLVLALGAAGAFFGTLAGARLAARIGPRLSLPGAVALQALASGAAAVAPSLPVLAGVWFLNGIPAGAQRPIAQSLQQRLTPNDLLGRVNVTARIVTRGIIVIGALFAGALATRSGVRSSFAVGGLAQLAAAAMMWSALGRGPLVPDRSRPHDPPRRNGADPAR